MNLGHITGEEVYGVRFQDVEAEKERSEKMSKYRVLILKNGNESLVNTSNIKSIYRDYDTSVTFMEDNYKNADSYLDNGKEVDMVVIDISGKDENQDISALINNIEKRSKKPVILGIADESTKKDSDYIIPPENFIHKINATNELNIAIYNVLQKMYEPATRQKNEKPTLKN